MTTRILVFGKNGQVGFELCRSLSVLGEVVALDRRQCDMSSRSALARAVSFHQPDIIVNATAYTGVDDAEREVDTAMAVNANAVEALASAAHAIGALLVHYSTDYVFDGLKSEPYLESDPTAPQSSYGRSKVLGEDAIRAVSDKHLIFRTSWIYASRGKNFLRTMLRLMQQKDELSVVSDQFGAPTGAALIADVTAQVLTSYIHRDDTHPFEFGTFHLTAAGFTSWHGYAQYIATVARELGVELTVPHERIFPIPSSAYPLPAKRPANSQLDTRKLTSQFQLHLPRWEDGVVHALQQLAGK